MSEKSTNSHGNGKPIVWYEAIRKRPGMYVGRMNINGFMGLLKGMLSNTLYTANKHTKCLLSLHKERGIKIQFKDFDERIKNHWEWINPGPQKRRHLGMETINALSKRFEIRFLDKQHNQIAAQTFREGKLIEGGLIDAIDCHEIILDFELDADMWGEDFQLNELYVSKQLQEFAYLHKHAWFELLYQIKGESCRVVYHFDGGLKDRILLEELTGLGGSYFQSYVDQEFADFSLEVAWAFREYSVDEPYIRSFVNDEYTHEEGTHVDAVLKGLTYGVMRHFQKHELIHQYKISEKGMREDLICFLNIRTDAPMFSGCVRNKLANPEIIEPIADHIAGILHQKIEADPETTERLIRKFQM